jgi:hypothetical protein
VSTLDEQFDDEIVKGLGMVSGESDSLTTLAEGVHHANIKWWHDADGNPITRNFGEMIALCHSELSEALEGNRKSLKDNHLPSYDSQDVELIDCLIRILDMLGNRGVDVDAILWDKMIYNANRDDHKLSTRSTQNGKHY